MPTAMSARIATTLMMANQNSVSPKALTGCMLSSSRPIAVAIAGAQAEISSLKNAT